MHLACLALILNPGQAPIEAWTSCEEVYALVKFDEHLYAGTSGGVLVYSTERGWTFTQPKLERPVYNLIASSMRLIASGPFGGFRWDGSKWEILPGGEPETLASGTPSSSKARLDEDSGHIIGRSSGRDLGRPGRGKLYGLFDAQRGLIAGTSDGMWVYSDDAWTREPLPSESPMPRLHGLARAGRRGWVAGGLAGLAIGRPGEWERLNDRPVRRILDRGREVWVVYGDGTVDKLEPEADIWQHDVLFGAVKRPWASTIAASGDGLLIGGQAGWVEKSAREQKEVRPDWFEGDVVTAMTTWGSQLVVAGQKTGLHFRNGKSWKHFNAAHGLEDLWITAVQPHADRLWIATATRGLYSTDGRTVTKEVCPEMKLTGLLSLDGALFIGTMNGAYSRRGDKWTLLGTEVETTALLGEAGHVWVMSPYSAQRFKLGK